MAEGPRGASAPEAPRASLDQALDAFLGLVLEEGAMVLAEGGTRLNRRHRHALASLLAEARRLRAAAADARALPALAPGPVADTSQVLARVRAEAPRWACAPGTDIAVEVAPGAERVAADADWLVRAVLHALAHVARRAGPTEPLLLAAHPHREGVQLTAARAGAAGAEGALAWLDAPAGGPDLGLALAAEVAARHGGRWWRSEHGDPAVHLLLPGTAPPERGREVLIVDDDPLLRAAAAGWLREWGLVPVEAASGEAALAYLSGSRPAAVLLDVHLPGIQGLEVAERVRHAPATEALPILFVTGVHLPEAERAAKARFDGAWLPKGPALRGALEGELRRLGLRQAPRAGPSAGPPDPRDS